MFSISFRSRSSARNRELKRAVLKVFTQSDDCQTEQLAVYSESDWKGVLRWLDICGMALYFLDQARRTGVDRLVPQSILAELDGRLERNRERTTTLMREASLLCGWFDAGGIPYALLKGFTLTPDSVPDAALRWQADLDILVPRRFVNLARHYISRLGYTLHADTGRTLEFRAGAVEMPDISKLYSVHSERALELHVDDGQSDALNCRRIRDFKGVRISTLSPADILVQQALHLLKHLCGEHTRLSWVLEFRRHVETRKADAAFWAEARLVAAQVQNGDLAMGVAFWLAKAMFGPLDCVTPASWRAEALPERVGLWLRFYADEVLLSDAAGSKFYALLRGEIPGQCDEGKSARRILLPVCWPSRMGRPSRRERLRPRGHRYLIESQYFLTRLRFHVMEGFRFAIEVSRWRRAVARCGR